jgi:hypothetical protein
MRATLLQLDSDEMDSRRRAAGGDGTAGESPLRPRMSSARPALDREVRLRAIRRLTAERQERDAATTPRRRGGGDGAKKKKKSSGSAARNRVK